MASREEALICRLSVRRDRLAEQIASVSNEISSGMDETRLKISILHLNSLTRKLDDEIKYYTENSAEPNMGTVNDALKNQMKAEDLVLQLESALLTLTSDTRSSNSSNQTTKLPKLDLPKFKGDQLHWYEFWDRFEANVHSKQISDADKMAYLIGCTEGAARGAIAGLATTNENYTIAVQTLKNRFGSNQLAIDAHYSALAKLPKAQCTSVSCRSTLDTIEQHLRILEKLGEPPNGNHLRAMVLSKFPEKLNHEVHIMCKDNDITMTFIRENLNLIVRAMERSEIVSEGCAKIVEDTSSSSTTEALLAVAPKVDKPQNQRRNKRKSTTKMEGPAVKKPKRPCIFCKLTNHFSADCKKFTTEEARKEKLKGRCLTCLGRNHRTEECKRKRPCFRCKGEHLQVLCPQVLSQGKQVLGQNDDKLDIKTNCIRGNTFLQTAVADIINPINATTKRSRILLDSGSQRSYMTVKLAKSLKLSAKKEDLLLIYTFGSTSPQEILSPSVEVNIQTKRGICKPIHANIVPRITDKVPVASVDQEVDVIADDDTTGEGVDLLIGNDYICSFTREKKIQISSNLYLIDTDFGWILSGSAVEEQCNTLSVTTYCRCHEPSCPYFTQPDLPLRNIDVQFLWSLENIGITDSPKATRQEEAMNHFNETVKLRDGRYEVKWPWIERDPDLPSNFGLAYGRLKSLVKRMDEPTLGEYNDILQDQRKLGIIEECESTHQNHPIHYLPHHMVKQPGKKGRIVYDASAKITGKKSLNECLYSGPSMLEDLTALIIKCQTKRIGIMADIEKAFLQIGLQDEDRDVTRFLWLKDPKKEPTEDNLMHLRFRRVPFGIISSPFLLTATIRHHLSQSNKELLNIIADRCYVDNLVTGANSTLQAMKIYDQSTTALDQISMNMRDWVSNDKQFLDRIPEQRKAKTADHVKMLGLLWNLQKDTLKLNVTETHFVSMTPDPTKREVLRILARIFDPCGFVCPIILPMKLLFQRVCERKLKWDEKLPEDLKENLETILTNLKSVLQVELPRFIGPAHEDPDTSYELHCFTDASKESYAAVVYLTTQNNNGRTVSFVMGKSRVTRMEDKTERKTPRLELLGFLIGSRLLTYVKTTLELPIRKQHIWTDSQVVLCWMKTDKLLPPFEANRVNEIKRKHPDTRMLYVNTKMNPADVATRQERHHEFELWHRGPDFLTLEESFWPENRHILFSVGEALEDVDPGNSTEKAADENSSMFDEIHPGDVEMEPLDENIHTLKKLQSQHFPEEVRGKETHLSRNLDLYLDIDGVLRCGGRMTNTTWDYDTKHPILLPKDSEYTNDVIRKTHEENFHVGATHTLSLIRKLYWIPQGKAQVQKVIKRCSQCVRHGGGPYQLPQTPALPPERVNYEAPFTYMGVDYFGPLYVSTTNGKEKRWVALFTCLTIRAIHLEIVKDLTAGECLLALRRCIATNGVPKRIYSDNGTYFKLTAEVMTKPFCVERKIEWKFIPQLAPWHGGFYERLVALVKHCLKRTLDKQLLKDNALHTILKEVQAVVNTRPLTSVGSELTHILRPSDFLSLGKCLTVEPASTESPCEGTTPKTDLIASWKRGLQILEEFKNIFIRQYLFSLRERYQNSPKQPRVRSDRAPKIGDMVQIKSDSKNRLNWKVGQIVELLKGADGEHRVAKVKTDKNILTRSIGHLYPLEIDESQFSPPSPQHTVNVDHDSMDLEDIAPVSYNDLELDENTTPLEASNDNKSQENQVVSPSNQSQNEDEVVNPTIEVAAENEINDQENNLEELNNLYDQPEKIESPKEQEISEPRPKRDAAIRAREKILELTRHLLTLLH